MTPDVPLKMFLLLVVVAAVTYALRRAKVI